MSESYNEIMEALQEIKQEEEKEFENNLITRTISSLLEIEKEAMYGNLRAKNRRQEEIINEGLKEYKEGIYAN